MGDRAGLTGSIVQNEITRDGVEVMRRGIKGIDRIKRRMKIDPAFVHETFALLIDPDITGRAHHQKAHGLMAR